jgi:hypothetical protein
MITPIDDRLVIHLYLSASVVSVKHDAIKILTKGVKTAETKKGKKIRKK